jgi:hypothetical protein
MTKTSPDFSKIADALCPWGKCYKATKEIIGDRGIDRCWEMADGYGRVSIAELRARELSRDWSHVRDASDEAIQCIWDYLRHWGAVR